MQVRPILIALTLATAGATPAHAQLGGLVKKAKAAVVGDKPTAVVTTKAAPTGPVSVKPQDRIDAASIDLFARALVAEKSWLEERARIRTTLRSREDYGRCAEMAVHNNSPEGKKLVQYYLDMITSKENDGSAEFMTKLATTMQAEQDKIIFAKCGYDPAKYGPEPGPAALYQPSEHEAAKQVGIEQQRYALLKERITPFCAFDAAARGAGDVRIPGSGSGVFFVYEAQEAELLAPRCTELLAAMKAIS